MKRFWSPAGRGAAPVALALHGLMIAAPAPAQQAELPTTALERMSMPGPEARDLALRTGSWDVTFTIWPRPRAEPLVARNLVAQRRMIGPFLQEIMSPGAGSGHPDFRRIDYLGYDRVEGRWKYVSMDTRFPAGIMPAWSHGTQQLSQISLAFEPLGFVGFGTAVEGRLVLSDLVVRRVSADHEVKEQRFRQADGTGTEWLAVRYEYVRRH